jgi:ABC-type phosphate transport system substrate-binding protein
MKSIFWKISLVGTFLLAAALRAAEFSGVVVIVNKSVRVDHISAAALKDIYTGKTTYWPDGQSVGIAVLAGDTDGKTAAALAEASGMDATHFKTFWQRMVFSGRGQEPNKLNDAAALVAFVAATKGALALVPADADLQGVKIIEVN